MRNLILNANRLPAAAAALCIAGLLGAGAAATGQTARPQVGDPAPAISLPASDGTSRSLSELAGDTTTLVVFFRGTW